MELDVKKKEEKPKPTLCPYCGVRLDPQAVKCSNCHAPRCVSCSAI